MERRDYPASSNVEAVFYNPETLELTALFKGDKAYAYAGVESGIWEQLRDVKGSVGSLFAHLVRGGGYSFRKLEDEEQAALIVQVHKTEPEEPLEISPLPHLKRPRTRAIRKLGV